MPGSAWPSIQESGVSLGFSSIWPRIRPGCIRRFHGRPPHRFDRRSSSVPRTPLPSGTADRATCPPAARRDWTPAARRPRDLGLAAVSPPDQSRYHARPGRRQGAVGHSPGLPRPLGGLSSAVSARRFAFALLAYAFAAVMVGTTLPTPMYALYGERMHFAVLTTTVIYASYAGGV